MKKNILMAAILLLSLCCTSSAYAEIDVEERQRGGADLQNVHDRVLCVDGLKVFQTIVFGFSKGGGAAVSTIQLMEEKNGMLVPVRCSN